MTITYKDAQGIAGMRVAGRLAAELLDHLTPFVKPGAPVIRAGDCIGISTLPRPCNRLSLR